MVSAKTLERLSKFEFNVDFPAFKRMYMKAGGTERLAKHLWSEFNKFNHSILRLWGKLDLEQQRIVSRMLKKL